MRPLVERFSGRKWSIEVLGKPLASMDMALTHLACAGRACIAIGAGQQPGRPLVARWNGKTWSPLRVPTPANSVRPFLADVSCTSVTSCAADGGMQFGSGCVHPTGTCTQQPLVERWNGRRWSIQRAPLPTGETGETLNGVSCAPRRGCIVVGSYSNASGEMALAASAIGSGWTVQPSADPTYPERGGDLYGISCASATACVAVGTAGAYPGPFAMSWNGSSWTSQMAPVTGILSAVSCVSATACMAVGGAEFESLPAAAAFWNGRSWASLPTPMVAGAESVLLNAVWCASPTSCIAVGLSAQLLPIDDGLPLTEIWNGSDWRIIPTPTRPGVATTTLDSISCTSISACVAVGSTEPGGIGVHPSALTEQWNGTAWTIQSTPSPPASTLTGVSCTSAAACTAVGYTDPNGNIQDAAALIEGWDGSSWTVQSTPSPPLAVLNGVSCTSATSCEAVGSAGSSSTTLAEAWDGNSWTIQGTPTLSTWGDALNAVSCTATACQAVGSGLDAGVPVAESLG